MFRIIYVGFTILMVMLFTKDVSGQSSIFVRRADIPIAAPKSMEGYYDVQTGDVLVSIGEGVVLFGFSGNTFAALDRNQLSASSELGEPDVSIDFELAWVDLPEFTGLPVGVHNFGPMLPVYPRGEIEIPEINELMSYERAKEMFDVSAFFTYAGYTADYSLFYGVRGQQLLTTQFNVVRPTFPIAIPEPCSAILIPLAGAGLLRRRKT